MPKYIKLFEAFMNEAQPYKFDPLKTALTGSEVYSGGTYYAKFPAGRIYIATQDSETLKTSSGNVTVFLPTKNADVEKKLKELGGAAAPKQNGELAENPAGQFKYLAMYVFNLTDPIAGDNLLANIAKALSPVTSSTGTAGSAGSAGSAGNYADQFFGGDIMKAFRSHVADVTGVAYQATSSIPLYQAAIQNKQVEAKLKEDPEFLKLVKQTEDQAKKTGVVDFSTGKAKDGKVDAEYMALRQKVSDRTAVIRAQVTKVGSGSTGTSGTAGTAGKI
jgi:hypothetical protein